ncbi:hypothetical protein BDW02DRAFT_579541 [Decorospora gaudefroyi]|uniref:Uncharacterized protein n=1 Tax=Decorospora gaudefroyi TaxID=184978 RepID=A0A6A5KAX7_9PLEO|nr:hypothetical protein BDW02DRAFT_579541 [Decorospora gaudefroyi]
MSNIVNTIGVVSGVFTIITFFKDGIFGGPPDPAGATVRIKAGVPELLNEGDSLGGSIDKIYAFGTDNKYLGQSDGCDIGTGGLCTRTVDQTSPGKHSRYISVSNNADATCISWISVLQHDGLNNGAWSGDIGYGCGQAWYNSIERAGEKSDGSAYIPKCTWLDADYTNGIANAALKFDVFAYSNLVGDTINSNAACASTIFDSTTGPIPGIPGGRIANRPLWMTEQLIISNFTSQTADQLCNSAKSWGPDFIGPDGKFCDMSSKTLAPLCAMEDIDGCVEMDEGEGTLKKRMNVARRSTSAVHKSYKKIDKWGQ